MGADEPRTASHKRPRTSENVDGGSSSAQFIPDEDYWFTDGNLILLARGVAFRIYKNLLAAQSPIFADMFATCAPDTGECLYGCPIVQLSDSPEDLRHLLEVLLPKSEPTFYHPQDEFQFTFDQISAVIRLAHKYRIESVQEQALAALKTGFPDTFEAYRDMPDDQSLIEFEEVHAIGAVTLARLTDTPSILPFALYRCCALGSALLDGWTREDGWVEHLSLQDVRRVIDGRDALAREAVKLFHRVFSDHIPAPNCTTRETCRLALAYLEHKIGNDDEAGSYDVLSTWATLVKKVAKKRGLCQRCVDDVLFREESARGTVWFKLPTIFNVDVDGWAGLSKKGKQSGSQVAADSDPSESE